TNDNRYSKLLVQMARQKIGDQAVPVLLVERYVTFKDGEEQAVEASGKNLVLYHGFPLNLDLGQIVPPNLGGDLRFVAEGGKVYAEPLGKAKLYRVPKPLPGTEPKKTDKVVVGDTFAPRYFNGTYKLYDDGRRSGKLTLKVEDDHTVRGVYY